MTLPDAPDFQGQTAQTLAFIEAIPVNTSGTQTVDITALVQPNFQGLVFFWVASFASAGEPIEVQAAGSTPNVTFNDPSFLADGGTLSVPFYGAIFVGIPGNVAIVQASLLSGQPAPVTGTLYVFGTTAPVTVIPVKRLRFIGTGGSAGPTNVTTGATTTMVADPLPGQYYRIKLLTWRSATAPAAAAAIKWLLHGTAFSYAETECTVVAGQYAAIPCDLVTQKGVDLQNLASNTIVGAVFYEVWNV